MAEIWKYALKITGAQTIQIPLKSKILKIDVQRDVPCLWVLVKQSPTDKKVKCKTFVIKGTGCSFEERGLKYIDTFMVQGGSFVWHVFLKK